MLTLCAFALLASVCVHADLHTVRTLHGAGGGYIQNGRSYKALELPSGCLYDGRWFKDGAVVPARDACLRCACGRGALACTRRACAAPPDPPPPRCHLRYRKGACCPELHCPDGITTMEHSASARLEREDFDDIARPASIAHACVEGGAIYAAGSAMGSRAACETCFCLGGGRRCVRPRCLPPPSGCRARPTIGACCPTRYYCDHQLLDYTSSTTVKPKQHHVHDCRVDGKWISEGERVTDSTKGGNCTVCFCLRGSVLCQPLACAPPLHGCMPLIRPGQCCPHQYNCPHHNVNEVVPHRSRPAFENALAYAKDDDRSLQTTRMSLQEPTARPAASNIETTNNMLIEDRKTSSGSTTKVKRKTSDPPTTVTGKTEENVAKTSTSKAPTQTTVAAKLIMSTIEASTAEVTSETTSTEQPESSIRIMVNGTINCTAELTSTTVSLNATNTTAATEIEAQPKIPFTDVTSNPNDIITDRIITDYDDNDSFTINVTSSLRTNTSHSTNSPLLTTVASSPLKGSVDTLNVTKKTKGEYDYDYTEPTLPPSLPNLKIIPFVAADAVVDENIAPKVPLVYPLSEREDKYPIYYPTVESKDHLFASRREDVYNPTQYPIFVSNKVEAVNYPKQAHNAISSELDKDQETAVKEFTVTAALGTRVPESKRPATKPPMTTTFKVATPAVNLFSPPVETEGGFIPKGPGIIDEYYAVYPSTHAPLNLPHLTTSMQLNTVKESTCLTTDGRPVPEGETIDIACSVCSCAWGDLHCVPRPCNTPEGCLRRPASNSRADICCGELICDEENNTTTSTSSPTTIIDEEPEEMPTPIQSDIIPFDPPPDRSVPEEKEKVEITHRVTVPKKEIETNTAKMSPENINTNVTTKNSTNVSKNTTIDKVTFNKTMISKPTEKPITSTTEALISQENSEELKETQSQEYEEEEDDEGFSFGSVLKLLLSESYDSTTTAPNKKKPTITTTTQATTTITQKTTTTRKSPLKPTVAPFVPIPHQPYLPPKKPFPHQTVNKIDHLVLGEATAIKKATPRPDEVPRPNPLKPVNTVKPFTKTTRRPFTTIRPPTTSTYRTTTKPQMTDRFDSVVHEERHPGISSSIASNNALPGVLKLAGCNIYGRMYRVGRIIAELSTACQECRCTEFGVQCRPLDC